MSRGRALEAVYRPCDLANPSASTLHSSGKPVAAVCHGPAVLRSVKGPGGEPAVKGKRITAFSNSEEAAVGLTAVVPFLLEDEFVRLGAVYSRVADWAPHAEVDGLLVTGQNPASAEPAVRALLALLAKA